MSAKRINHRIFDRKPFDADVILTDEHGRGVLRLATRNLSSNGVALATDIPFPRGMRLFLRIPLADGQAPLCVHGEVLRWIHAKEKTGPRLVGIGVRFVHLTASDILRLEQFLRGVCG
jgi:hypothetical protein